MIGLPFTRAEFIAVFVHYNEDVWAWLALAYFLAYFWEINPAAPLFALVALLGASVFAWHGVVRRELHYSGSNGPWLVCASALIGYALIFYPLLSTILGRGYPQAATFGLPCPTTIFTLAVLLLLRQPFPRRVFVAPILWVPIGVLAAVYLDVIEDFALLPAGFAGFVAALQPFRKSTHVLQAPS